VRFLILPGDPEAFVLEFDEELTGWWLADRDNPFEGGGQTSWGTEEVPTASAIIRFYRASSEKWIWSDYLALHRSGALEFGLDRFGSGTGRRQFEEGELRVFFLNSIVGRIWWALALYAEVMERYRVTGPWEIGIALRDTAGSVLGDVAAGWMEPGESWRGQPPACPYPNVLLLRELSDWPTGEDIRALVFSLGGVIEDAWGVHDRRFLARVEPGIGEFGASQYR
jgi:hypothetical protein